MLIIGLGIDTSMTRLKGKDKADKRCQAFLSRCCLGCSIINNLNNNLIIIVPQQYHNSILDTTVRSSSTIVGTTVDTTVTTVPFSVTV